MHSYNIPNIISTAPLARLSWFAMARVAISCFHEIAFYNVIDRKYYSIAYAQVVTFKTQPVRQVEGALFLNVFKRLNVI